MLETETEGFKTKCVPILNTYINVNGVNTDLEEVFLGYILKFQL
jgi:hypothetical protein